MGARERASEARPAEGVEDGDLAQRNEDDGGEGDADDGAGRETANQERKLRPKGDEAERRKEGRAHPQGRLFDVGRVLAVAVLEAVSLQKRRVSAGPQKGRAAQRNDSHRRCRSHPIWSPPGRSRRLRRSRDPHPLTISSFCAKHEPRGEGKDDGRGGVKAAGVRRRPGGQEPRAPCVADPTTIEEREDVLCGK